MILYMTLALLISILLYILVITRSEGFNNPPRPSNNPAWANLSDDNLLELILLRKGAMYAATLVDESQSPSSAQVLKDMITVFPPETAPVSNDDMKSIKNLIINKASQDRAVSVAVEIIFTHFQQALDIHKRIYAASQQGDENACNALEYDWRGIIKTVVQDIRVKIPNFPFNPVLKKQFPEAFPELPKPDASESKRFFKCSSIYAA